MFEIEYIYHDCFLIVCEECSIIFDYWKDPASVNDEYPALLADIPSDIPLYVLVSHFHKDHFNKSIFKWDEKFEYIHYIVSEDTARHAGHLLRNNTLYKGKRPDISSVTVMKKGEEYSDEILKVKAFGSTDIGNSYVLELRSSGLKIFHAGDLNCWTWREESTQKEILEAEKAFRKELVPIVSEYPELDIAMFPVDNRIGLGYSQGASEFVRAINVKRFFPMHFELADNEEELKGRKKAASGFYSYAAERGEYIALTNRGDRYADFRRVVQSS